MTEKRNQSVELSRSDRMVKKRDATAQTTKHEYEQLSTHICS